MNDDKSKITLLACCCIILTISSSASADFVGVTIVTKDDPDTEFLCTQGNGDWIPGPLTVCNVFAVFDVASNVLTGVGDADLQVYNGANPDVFFQHPFNFTPFSPPCAAVRALPDLICDTFITIGYKCDPGDPSDGTAFGNDFGFSEFSFNGHILGGWFNAHAFNGQGEAGNNPDMQVLFLQSSVTEGLSLSGTINIFWRDHIQGSTFAELAVPIECAGAGDPAAIPTVSEWGLIIMTLLALTAGTIVFARRRKTAMA